jgi:hypothetical protein
MEEPETPTDRTCHVDTSSTPVLVAHDLGLAEPLQESERASMDQALPGALQRQARSGQSIVSSGHKLLTSDAQLDHLESVGAAAAVRDTDDSVPGLEIYQSQQSESTPDPGLDTAGAPGCCTCSAEQQAAKAGNDGELAHPFAQARVQSDQPGEAHVVGSCNAWGKDSVVEAMSLMSSNSATGKHERSFALPGASTEPKVVDHKVTPCCYEDTHDCELEEDILAVQHLPPVPCSNDSSFQSAQVRHLACFATQRT